MLDLLTCLYYSNKEVYIEELIMNKSKILELAASEESYMEKISLAENAEYKKGLKEVRDMVEKLCKNMTEEEKDETLWRFEAARSEVEAITVNEYFKQGFKLGFIIAAQNFLE